MEIYVLRHGIAYDAAPGEPDSERALTPEGKQKLERVLKRARSAGTRPVTILTSPYRRALETARMAATILESKVLFETAVLKPGGRPEEIWQEARLYLPEGPVLLAGHEPVLSETVSYLLGAPDLAVDMKKGAIVAIDIPATSAVPRGVLRWMLTSKLCS
jgi:phosphohistidine phosphatase